MSDSFVSSGTNKKGHPLRTFKFICETKLRIVTIPADIPVFKAVPELLRRRPGTSNKVFHDVDDIIPELADQVISLDGDLGHSFMAFKMGTSAAAGLATNTIFFYFLFVKTH